MTRKPITPEGYRKLLARLDHLKRVEMPKIVQAIEEAREHGDISENAEFHAAKEQQGIIQAQIHDIQARLSNLNIVDVDQLSMDHVTFGSTVVLEDLDNGQKVTYQLVGEDEADPGAGKISIISPVALALKGKKIGEEIQVRTPKGIREFEVLDIR
ncbi:MAG: transcription elongation factor GreA [Deltaproteobacteria bacterium]|nr:transcription elongation factor GreA [Deltaproteobacteria bacterium]MBW2305727.1 transcription elongation factor GreA [Deltaproteobacteria bacterium]